jgi:fatty-acyl-CoA synthase
MRVEEKILIDAGREEVWAVIADPSRYLDWMAGITRWDSEGDKDGGLGARYSMRMRVGSADIGGLIEFVEWLEPDDVAWTNITGLDHRGRFRLRERDGGTLVTFRLAYQSPGGLLGLLADRVSPPLVRKNLRGSLERLKIMLEGSEPAPRASEEGGTNAMTSIGNRIHNVRVLAGAGLVKPERPDRTLRALRAYTRWRPTPAAGYTISAIRYPNETAIIDELGTLTFAEVDKRTNRLASSLADAGIGEGDGVAIMARNHRGFVEAIVAVSKLGANALLLNTSFAGPQLTEVVKREKPVAIIYDEEFTDLLSEAAQRRKRFIAWHDEGKTKDRTLDELTEQGDPSDPVPPAEPGRAVILTSGTTGTPKGASRKQPEGLDPAASLLSKIPLRARENTMIAAPLFHSWGFAHFTLGMLLNSTLVLERKFDPERTLAMTAQHECTTLVVVPIMMQRILDLPEETRRKYDLSKLRVVAASGSALPGELATAWMDEFGENLYNLYGSTEVAWATIATPQDLREAPGTAGAPPRGTILKLYDEAGLEVPEGQTGRIFVGNEMLFEGYTGGGSKAVIDGLMSTGDVGRLDEKGRLFVEGRDDEMIVSGGENVFPREVEDLLSKHEKVSEVAVIGIDDKDWGQRLKAFVVPRSGEQMTEDEVKSFVKSNLARYKVPREVEFMEELPRNPTGKVLKRELK